jgi:hypothetical protein
MVIHIRKTDLALSSTGLTRSQPWHRYHQGRVCRWNKRPTCSGALPLVTARKGGDPHGDIGSVQKPTFQDCIDECDLTSGCAAVVYSGTACYMKSTYSGNGSSGPGLQTDVLQGFTPAPTLDCPAADGITWTNVLNDGSIDYVIHCNAGFAGGDLTSTPAPTFAECISACSMNGQCVDVSYVSGTCYLKSHLTTMGSANGVWISVQKTAADRPSIPASP